MKQPTVLLIDNYDSYTYNLSHLIASVTGAEPRVVTNDSRAWAAPDRLLGSIDAVVISPGPGQPAGTNVGEAREVLTRASIPTLGVCLGHQLIAVEAGGIVDYAAHPRHGHLTTVYHVGHGMFEGIPQGFTGVRYHSLAIRRPVPPTIEVLAWSEDHEIMAIAHRHRPWWGVQFHPESICSEYGGELMRGFLTLAGLVNTGRAA